MIIKIKLIKFHYYNKTSDILISKDMRGSQNFVIILFLVIIIFYIIFQHSAIFHVQSNSPKIQEVKERLSMLNPEWRHFPIYVDDSAYTMDKSRMYLCLKDRQTGEVFGVNTLMYVALHEMAHVLTKEKEKDEHGPIFKRNFANLLRQAIRIGIYDPTQPLPTSYCGAHS